MKIDRYTAKHANKKQLCDSEHRPCIWIGKGVVNIHTTDPTSKVGFIVGLNSKDIEELENAINEAFNRIPKKERRRYDA